HKYPDVNCNETTWDNQCLEHRQKHSEPSPIHHKQPGSGKEIRNHASSFSAQREVDQPKFICEKCGSSFNHMSSLLRHKKQRCRASREFCASFTLCQHYFGIQNILKGTRNIAALIPNVERNSTPQWDFDSITESINLNFSVKIAANSFLLRLDCKITRENTTELEHVNEKMFVHKTLMRVKWQFKISMLTATFF
uniref:C2H2-type domain-containing protein n=1 Tax=Loa loa TaxID=7209 RepID=A0A1I7VBW1_LOALO